MKKLPSFNYKNCISCSMCSQSCPVSAIEMSLLGKHGKYANIFPKLDREKCIGCGTCANACVMYCIEMTTADYEN